MGDPRSRRNRARSSPWDRARRRPGRRRGRRRARSGRDLSWCAFMSAFLPRSRVRAAVIFAREVAVPERARNNRLCITGKERGMGRVSVGARFPRGENQGVDRGGAMVQERRGTYQDGGASPHPPSSLSPSFGRCVCLIHRGHPPTSPGPHPPAPSTLRRLRCEKTVSGCSGANLLQVFCRVKASVAQHRCAFDC